MTIPTFFPCILNVYQHHVEVNLPIKFAFHLSLSPVIQWTKIFRNTTLFTKSQRSSYHCHGHFINFMFVFCLMLAKWTMTKQNNCFPVKHVHHHTHPLSNLYNIQPNENQSALESYATPLAKTSGAIYPCVPTLACGFFLEKSQAKPKSEIRT